MAVPPTARLYPGSDPERRPLHFCCAFVRGLTPLSVPDLEVAPVRVEHGARAEEAVVEVEVEVLRLEHVHHPDARHSTGEPAPRLERVVALQRHARLELLRVRLRRGPDRRRLAPRARRVRVVRPTSAE